LQKRRKNEIGGNLLILDAIAYLSRLVCEIPAEKRQKSGAGKIGTAVVEKLLHRVELLANHRAQFPGFWQAHGKSAVLSKNQRAAMDRNNRS